MDVEYEATFTGINKGGMRKILKRSGAKLAKPEFVQKSVVFDMPAGHEIRGGVATRQGRRRQGDDEPESRRW